MKEIIKNILTDRIYLHIYYTNFKRFIKKTVIMIYNDKHFFREVVFYIVCLLMLFIFI